MTFNRNAEEFYKLQHLLQQTDFPYLNEEKFGVTREDCINYISQLSEARRKSLHWPKTFLSLLLPFSYILMIGGIILAAGVFFDTKHHLLSFLILAAAFIGATILTFFLAKRVQQMNKGLECVRRRLAPKPREDVELLLSDYMTKRDIWEHGNEQEKDAVCQEYDPGFYGFRDALFEEIQHPSEDCALADVKFGMTLEELYQTNTLKGLKQSEQPSLNSIRSMLVGEMVGYGNPFVFFHLRNGKLAEVSIEFFELVRNLFRMDDETAEAECQKVIDAISDNLKRFYGPTLTVGKKFFDIVYSKSERPKVFIRHTNYSL